MVEVGFYLATFPRNKEATDDDSDVILFPVSADWYKEIQHEGEDFTVDVLKVRMKLRFMEEMGAAIDSILEELLGRPDTGPE